jgi:hypothetical protein
MDIHDSELTCPYCGEPAEVDLDPGSLPPDGSEEFIQDCAVCCRPWRVLVEADEDLEPHITLLREDE